MDSQDSSAPPHHSLHHHHHHHNHRHHHPPPPPPSSSSILVSQPQPNSYPLQSSTANNNLIHHQNQQQNPASAAQATRFPFNSMVTSSGPKPFSDYSDGGGAGGGGGDGIEPSKKKRGRPRKYSPDGAGSSIALGLSPTSVTPISSSSVVAVADSAGGGGGGGGGTLSSENPAKKHRGRPPGSIKRQLDALGSPGVGFTPHVITVKAGEDIASKIMAFSQQGPRTVCILSANGAICNVTLRQPAMSGGTVTYEGRFEIISLSGSFLLSENNGSRSRSGGLSVSLAGSDGRVLGGGVAGMLMAATPVQVVVGSFIADGKKPKSGSSPAPAPNMLNFGNPVMEASPPSHDASSDSSDDNGSPINHGSGPYGNAQPMQNMSMYTNMGWPNSTKMHPN